MKRFLFRKKKKAESAFLKSQAERIEELRAENEELRKRLSAFTQKEREITDTLVFAKKRQEEFLGDLRLRYTLESERLARFARKMESFRSKEELIRAYDTSFAALKSARNELDRIIREDLGEGTGDFLSERARLGDTSPLPFSALKDEWNDIARLSEEEWKEIVEG